MKNYVSSTNNNKFSNLRPEGTEINKIVITYSVLDDIYKTINTMYDRGTSIHYTIRPDGFQAQHHLESSQAFYAGKSSWHGKSSLNTDSIGIMLINDSTSAFSEMQINKLIDLIKDINTRHEKTMEVLGLGEVAVDRHIAPGKYFPWLKLAEKGIGTKITFSDSIDKTCKINLNDTGENVSEFQRKLIQHGYAASDTGVYDELTAKVITVFTDRYVPGHDNCWSDATEHAINTLVAQGYNDEL